MIAAGLDPDAVMPVQASPGSGIMEVCDTPVNNSKKRMPSGSPDVKAYNAGTCSDDTYDDAVDGLEEEASCANWHHYQLKKQKNSPEKNV